MRLKDKVTLITGASRGIGRASALALAKEGAIIVGVARTEADLSSLADELKAAGADKSSRARVPAASQGQGRQEREQSSAAGHRRTVSCSTSLRASPDTCRCTRIGPRNNDVQRSSTSLSDHDSLRLVSLTTRW